MPMPKPEVGVRVPVDLERVGVVEHRLVAVGRLVEHEDPVADLEVDALVGVGLGDGAVERQHRGHEADDLVDGRVDQRRVGQQLGLLGRGTG